MTLVSIEDSRRFSHATNTFEIGVHAHVRHGCEDLGKAAFSGPSQRRGQNRPMFCLRTATVGNGLFFERPHKGLIDAANQEIRHVAIPAFDIIHINFLSVGSC